MPSMHRTTGTVAVATCALVALLAAGAIVVVDGAVVSEGCICSDVRPRVGTGPTHVERFAVADTCAEIRAKGQCDEKWMLDTVKELEGQGYCMMTCGRCKCCKPVAETLRAAGLTSLVDAAAGTPYEEAFNDPAFMAAVLAPPAGTKVAPSALGSYILPPVVEWGDATYTAALLAAETASVMNASGGRLPVGAFKVVKGDIQACKAVVHAVDKAVA